MSARRVQRPDRQHRAWLRARARLAPNLLVRSPAWVRGVFDHGWAAMQALEEQAGLLPPGLPIALLGIRSGYIFVVPGDAGESSYQPGAVEMRGRSVENVAHVSVGDLARSNEQPLHVVGHLIDHHLGCGGRAEGPWLSAGGGLFPEWAAAGARLQSLFELDYGIDAIARSAVRDYFAQSLAFFCRDRRSLNIADPQIEKWFRVTLWNEAFWHPLRQDERRGT